MLERREYIVKMFFMIFIPVLLLLFFILGINVYNPIITDVYVGNTVFRVHSARGHITFDEVRHEYTRTRRGVVTIHTEEISDDLATDMTQAINIAYERAWGASIDAFLALGLAGIGFFGVLLPGIVAQDIRHAFLIYRTTPSAKEIAFWSYVSMVIAVVGMIAYTIIMLTNLF